MAKTFDPSTLSADDQAAYSAWQQQLREYVAQNGGAVPAPVGYALAHPDYLKTHPELQAAYDIVSGATLPATTKVALKGFHPVWSAGKEGMQKNSGLFSKWETWLQLGLGAGVGGYAAAALAPAAAGGTGATAAGGSATAGSAASGGAVAGGASGAGSAAGAAATGSTLWSKIGKVAEVAGPIAGQVIGSTISANAQKHAADLEAQAAEQALEWQKQQYGVRQRQLAPAINVGNASTQQLAYLMGLQPGEGGWGAAPPETQPGYQPPAVPRTPPENRNPNAAPVAPAAPATDAVQMRSPRGTVGWIPRANLDAAIRAGGQVVQ